MSTEPEVERRGVVAVIMQEERFLVIRRSQFVRAPGAFCFPGGAIEPGESEPLALYRELREELTADVRAVNRLWQCLTPSGVRLAWWKARLESERPLEPNPAEVESFHWYTTDQMLALRDLLPTNRDFLAALRRGEFTLER